MKKLILLACILVFGYTANAQISDQSYKPKVKELMKIQSGQAAMMDKMIDQVSENIPESKKADFKKEMRDEVEKLYDQIADIYMEVYNKKEIDALLKFYHSPVGKEIQEKMPKVMEKSTKLGQQFGQRIMPIVQKYMN